MKLTHSFVVKAASALALAASLQAPARAAEANLNDVALATLGAGYTDVTSTFFSLALTGPFTFTLLSEDTAHASNQSFSVNGNVIFNGAAVANATATVSVPLTSFLFNSNANGTPFNFGQYAPGGSNALVKYLRQGNDFVLGYEDWTPGGTPDYNDMIVKMSVATVSAVPEPQALALLLAGVGVVGFLGRRRRA